MVKTLVLKADAMRMTAKFHCYVPLLLGLVSPIL